MSIIRWFLAKIILFLNWITLPKRGKRPEQQQVLVEQALKNHSLYQFHACPFCVLVRRTLIRLNLPIEIRDAKNSESHRAELIQQGGKLQVPCLRIQSDNGENQWLYESKVITAYLQKTFPIDSTENKN